ncbi:hypothetical protein BDQ12DRAFT_573531, partial [Crucibulum laeve]
GASHDSRERYPPPRCHPGTRTEVISHLMNHLGSTHSSANTLWLHGAVGIGKSAISQTAAEICEEKCYSLATFFFSRTSPENNERKLVPTIAHQLAQSIPTLKHYLNRSLEGDPTILEKSPTVQIQKLLLDPLR